MAQEKMGVLAADTNAKKASPKFRWKDAKRMAKVIDNIVINDDGTQIDIGGNVAVESIEQLGYMGTVPATNAEVEATAEYQTVSNVLIARNVDASECVFVGDDWTEAPYDGRIVIDDNECRIIENQAEGKWCIAIQPGYDGQNHPTKVFYLNQGKAGKVVLNATALIQPTAKNFEGFKDAVPEHLEFMPFFTEAQYEALLALIED